MIVNCPNCAGRVIYDIEKSGLSCLSCGNFIDSKDFRKYDSEVISEDEEMMDFRIFSCKTCGAKITATDTEASAYCLSCGNPTLVFDRITKLQRPKKILPFTVSKERAMKAVEEKKKAIMVSKAFKDTKIEQLHGIYVPYYITSVEYDGSMVGYYVEDDGDNKVKYYTKSSAYATYKWVSTDASSKLNDRTSQMLEPFHFSTAVDFNENYLVGFYSDIADVDEADAIGLAKKRVTDEMEYRIRADISRSMITGCRSSSVASKKPLLALLPMWALTFRHEGNPYTILVNGQTGKVVGGLPFDKKRFALAVAGVSAVAMLVVTPLMFFIVQLLMAAGHGSSLPVAIIALLLVIGATVAIGLKGYQFYEDYIGSIYLTTEKKLDEYSTNRHGGDAL